MTTINMNEIRKEIVGEGLMYEEDMINANINVIIVSGEWTFNDDVEITDIRVGVREKGSFFKGIKKEIELPAFEVMEDLDEAGDKFKAEIQKMYPEFTIWLRLD